MKQSNIPMMFLVTISVLSLFSLLASATDPDPVQDYCVSVNESSPIVHINGMICKDPRNVTADDFYFAGGLDKPHAITNPLGTKITVAVIPGLNTQGLAMSRVDFAPRGLNPPHVHPRSSEMILVLKGHLYAGFITSDPLRNPNEKNKLFAKILNPGDTFVFPRGLIHFNYNTGYDDAAAIVCFNSQNPGTITIGKALFGSSPPVYPRVLAEALRIDEKMIEYLQSLEWMGN